MHAEQGFEPVRSPLTQELDISLSENWTMSFLLSRTTNALHKQLRYIMTLAEVRIFIPKTLKEKHLIT